MWDFSEWEDQIAVYEGNHVYTYRQLEMMQKKFSQYFKQRSLVCLVVKNDLASLVGYVSCLQNHQPVMVLSADSTILYREQMWRRYRPQVIWMSRDCEQDHREYFEQHDGYSKCKEAIPMEWGTYTCYRSTHKEIDPVNRELALLLPTSGSTGNPKLVRISYENIITNTKSICAYMKLTGKDCAITALPFSYTYGLSVVNTILYRGGRLCLTKESILSLSFWAQFERRKVTFLPGVPYTYFCMKKMNIRLEQYEALRILTQAGGRLSEELQKYWGEFARKNKKKLYIMYGQTEATARISYLPPEVCLEKLGSVGLAIPGTELRLVNDQRKTIEEPYQKGEVAVYGRHVSMGYAEHKEDLAKGYERKYRLYTGDIGYMDEEGYLYITGRKSRFAKLYGKRIDLDDLERQLESIYDREIAAVSDDKIVYLVWEGNLPMTTDEIAGRAKRIIGVMAVVESRVLDKIPRKENGKKDYRKILQSML